MARQQSFRRAVRRAVRGLFRRSGIEAGGGGRRWEEASTVHSGVNSTLAARAAVKSRAGGLFANSAHGRRAVEARTTTLAGKGWQARCLHPDRDRAQEVNDEFEAFVNPMLWLIVRAVVRDGEAFIHLLIGRDGRQRLQVMNPEQIDSSSHRELDGGGYIAAGVEFDADGDKVAYHVLPDAPGATFPGYGPARRIPATDILHVFNQLYPGQLRGIPWPSPVLLKMRDRDDASDAILSQLKVSSLLTGFITDPEGGAGGFDGHASATRSMSALSRGPCAS